MNTTPILFEDEHFLVVNKPPFLETISANGGSLCFTIKLRNECDNQALYPVHRLDRDTSGVLVFGKGKKAVHALHDQFKNHLIKKTYYAVCLNHPSQKEGMIRRRLTLWGGGHHPVKVVKEGGVSAETGYSVFQSISLEKFQESQLPKKLSIILFYPKQGRTHQIRVHASSMGMPILGDDQYGDRLVNRWFKDRAGVNRQLLHSRSLTMIHPFSKNELTIEAPLWSDLEEFEKAVDSQK